MNAEWRESTGQPFEVARTHGAWLDLQVEDDILRRAYEKGVPVPEQVAAPGPSRSNERFVRGVA